MPGATVIIGMGGLGCPAAVALAASGARRLTLVDGDVVETSNLHRQPLYAPEDVGRPKVDVARERLVAGLPRPGDRDLGEAGGPGRRRRASRRPRPGHRRDRLGRGQVPAERRRGPHRDAAGVGRRRPVGRAGDAHRPRGRVPPLPVRHGAARGRGPDLCAGRRPRLARRCARRAPGLPRRSGRPRRRAGARCTWWTDAASASGRSPSGASPAVLDAERGRERRRRAHRHHRGRSAR